MNNTSHRTQISPCAPGQSGPRGPAPPPSPSPQWQPSGHPAGEEGCGEWGNRTGGGRGKQPHLGAAGQLVPLLPRGAEEVAVQPLECSEAALDRILRIGPAGRSSILAHGFDRVADAPESSAPQQRAGDRGVLAHDLGKLAAGKKVAGTAKGTDIRQAANTAARLSARHALEERRDVGVERV